MAATVQLPFGRGKRFLGSASRTTDLIVGGWQLNTITTIQSGLGLDVLYPGGAERDTGPNRPDLIGDLSGRQPEAERAPGPGYWRVDASLAKELRVSSKLRAELRVEAVNLFNHVNLGLPDREIGTPTDPRPNAGRISNTTNFGTDPLRNLQFVLRLSL